MLSVVERPAMVVAILLVLAAFAAGGRAQQPRPLRLLSRTPPVPTHVIDARFEGVELLGYDLDHDVVARGGSVAVIWYWHCTRTPPTGFRQFTHLLDAGHGNVTTQDDVGPVRRRYHADHWPSGVYVTDPQTLRIPDWFPDDTVWVGVGFWNGPYRLRVVRPVGNTDNNTVLALQLRIVSADAGP